jgi:hypothetical protein
MIFPYTKVTDFPKHQKRERLLPWIRFGIFNPKNKFNILFPMGLVDSGSELTFINYEIGEALGYDIKKGEPINVVGVGGGKIAVYFHKVNLIIEDNKEKFMIEDQIAFTYNEFPSSMPQQTAILGTIGFFRHFSITFNFPSFINISKLRNLNAIN